MRRRLVVEADGGSRGNPGPAGYGALVRDGETGELLVEVGESIPLATNNVAEYEGLVAGLKAAVAIDPECAIEVRMDSRLVVEQLSGRWSIKHEDMRRLAGFARELIPGSRVTYTWIPRAENAHADRLANAAMDAGTGSNRRMRLKLRPALEAARPDSAHPDRDDRSGPESGVEPAGARAWSVEVADLGEPTTVILVRHGRTDDTDQRRARGRGSAGPALNPAGQAQAEQLAEVLAQHAAEHPHDPHGPAPTTPSDAPQLPENLLGRHPVAVIASPLLRARQTGAVLAGALGQDPLLDGDWAEVALGDWDGLSYAEIAAGWPDQYRDWRRSTAVAPPGGESLDDVVKRVSAATDRLVAAYAGRTVVVVSHTAPIRAVLARALAAGPAALWRLRVDPTSVSVVRFWADGGCEVAGVNAVTHLR